MSQVSSILTRYTENTMIILDNFNYENMIELPSTFVRGFAPGYLVKFPLDFPYKIKEGDSVEIDGYEYKIVGSALFNPSPSDCFWLILE